MKKISLVIPCYNVSEYLDRCWKSIQNQSIGLDSLECIFVNDMSDDGGKTWDKLLKIEKDSPDSVILIDMEVKGGPGGCRNVGLKYASGKYLEFLDSDDELVDYACELLYETAEKYHADVIQFNHFHMIEGDRRIVKSCTANEMIKISNTNERAIVLCTGKVTYGVWNKFYRMELVRGVNSQFPPLVRYEEPLFVFPLFLYARNIFLLDEELYLYYRRPNSIISSEVDKHILDHPYVQLMLLENIMNRGEIFNQNFDAIELYFLWSFYCETLLFAARTEKSKLPLDFFLQMQEVCRAFFRNWRDNKYIVKENNKAWSVLETIDKNIKTQEEVNELVTYAFEELT